MYVLLYHYSHVAQTLLREHAQVLQHLELDFVVGLRQSQKEESEAKGVLAERASNGLVRREG